MLGQFALGLAITAPIFLLTNLQLRNVIATDAINQYSFADYFGLRILTASVACTIVALTVLITGYSGTVATVILAVGSAKAIESLSDIIYGLLQRNEKLKSVAISMIIKGPLSLFLVSITIFYSSNLVIGCAALALGWLTVLLLYDIRAAMKITNQPNAESDQVKQAAFWRPRWRTSTIHSLAYMALPLGFVEMIASFNINAPRYFIESNIGIEQLGIFSAMAYIMVAGGTIIYAIGNTIMPRLAHFYFENNQFKFKSLLYQSAIISLIIGLCGVLIALFGGEAILTILYKEEYAAHNNVFITLMIAAIFNYLGTILWFGIASARQFRIQLFLFGATLVLNVLFCGILTPSYGILGAATAFALAEAFRALFSFLILRHLIRSTFAMPL